MENKTENKTESRIENILPSEIEKRSFEIISEELKMCGKYLDPENAPIIKRAIHTTADFDYAENLVFSDGAARIAKEALKSGACIVTDTQMARSGINKTILKKYGGEVFCFMSDEDVAQTAQAKKITRAIASMDKACELKMPLIFAIGNAPTALIRLSELIEQNKIKPLLIIGVPVGFVNVTASKELIMQSGIPYIVAKGRKGGSTVAAAICNACLYHISD